VSPRSLADEFDSATCGGSRG